MVDIITQKHGILLHGAENNASVFQLSKQFFVNIDKITGAIIKVLDWFNNLPGSIPKFTADLLTGIYTLLTKIALQTPLFIFNNPYLKNTSLTFALISITIVSLFTVFETIMRMCKQEHTNLKVIAKRWGIVAAVSGFLPFAFEEAFGYLNKLSQAISKIGNINGGNANGFIIAEQMGFFDTLIICLFDLTAISMLIPFALQQGRRIFDLMALACVSPLALSAWVFDRHAHYFHKWLHHVKSLSLVQLIYSIFLLLMGVFIFATQSIQGGVFTIIFKILVVSGGLYRMCNPPMFIRALTDGGGDDVFDAYDKYKTTFKNITSTLLFRNFKSLNFIKGKQAEKLKKTQQLRKKHKRRFVGDLM